MTDEIIAARAALHMWEEPCISGKKGSGAVFFSGCPMGCVFCQNHDIALGRRGEVISEERLTEILLELEGKGANNINFVTPTHYVPTIIKVVRAARGRGLTIPIVYNTGSLEKRETIRALEGTVAVYLPDYKYDDPFLAERLCRAGNYPEVARAAIAEMVDQIGAPVFDARGIMTRGVIVRHLILPGHTKDSIRVLDYLHRTYGDRIMISLMNQYTPMPGIEAAAPDLGRKVTRREYDKVLDAALERNMTNVFYQEGGTAKESFIPDFDGEGLTHE